MQMALLQMGCGSKTELKVLSGFERSEMEEVGDLVRSGHGGA